MKRILIITILFTMVLSLVGCSKYSYDAVLYGKNGEISKTFKVSDYTNQNGKDIITIYPSGKKVTLNGSFDINPK